MKAPLVRWELQRDRSQRSDEQVRLLTSRMPVFGIYVLPSALHRRRQLRAFCIYVTVVHFS